MLSAPQRPGSTRDALLDAAYHAAVAGDWAHVRMADVAVAAGVSRQTLYKAFGSKDALAEAVAIREGARFVEGTVEVVRHTAGDPGTAAGAAVRWALGEAAANPLVEAALTDETAGLLPLLTTRSGALLVTLRDGIADALRRRWPDLPPDETAWVAEVGVRLAVSALVVPTEPVDTTADHVATLVRRLLT
ncbi:MAG: TetR family transcriptional regulator [Actinomycetes bacterium]